MQMATIQEAAWFQFRVSRVKKGTKGSFLTKIIQWAGRIVGSALFFLSFGAFALPALGAAGWIEATAIFVGVQFTAQVFIDLEDYWHKAAGCLWTVWMMVRRENIEERFEKFRQAWTNSADS